MRKRKRLPAYFRSDGLDCILPMPVAVVGVTVVLEVWSLTPSFSVLSDLLDLTDKDSSNWEMSPDEQEEEEEEEEVVDEVEMEDDEVEWESCKKVMKSASKQTAEPLRGAVATTPVVHPSSQSHQAHGSGIGLVKKRVRFDLGGSKTIDKAEWSDDDDDDEEEEEEVIYEPGIGDHGESGGEGEEASRGRFKMAAHSATGVPYISPHKKRGDDSSSRNMERLRRQIQGLVNRSAMVV